jgi:hypothetical protein
MAGPRMKTVSTVIPALLTVHLCVPDDQVRHLPRRRRAPERLPPNVPVPRMGDIVYLARTSAWGVTAVVHDWVAPDELRIEIWLNHIGTTAQHSGFAPLTQ